MTFALPKALTIGGEVCNLTLSGLNRLEVEVFPVCPDLKDDGETKVIILEINSNGKFWFGALRSIWVSISLPKVVTKLNGLLLLWW